MWKTHISYFLFCRQIDLNTPVLDGISLIAFVKETGEETSLKVKHFLIGSFSSHQTFFVSKDVSAWVGFTPMPGPGPVSERNKKCGADLTTGNTEPVHHFFCDPAEPVTGNFVIIKTEATSPLRGAEIMIYKRGKCPRAMKQQQGETKARFQSFCRPNGWPENPLHPLEYLEQSREILQGVPSYRRELVPHR